MIEIKRLTEASERAVEELLVLLPQLTNTAWPLTTERLRQILAAPNYMVVAMDGDRIVGVAMIAMVHQLKDTKAWLEDVVVDERYRGQGIARRLMEAAIEAAREAGARSVNMTSRPSRAAAHGLYEKLGFKKRESVVFRLPLQDSHL